MRVLRLVLTLATLTGICFCTSVQADVRLPKIFGDHMVLQRDQPIPIWGWADAGESITVTLGTATATTKAGEDGTWTTSLPAQQVGEPLTLTVAGKNKISLSDVLMGEVWVCSGQSNMEWTVNSCDNAEQERASADFPRIRHIQIPKRPAGFPQDDVDAQWTVCSPATVGGYTAVGYFFGRHLHQQLDVPVGLIHSSWGGTRIEPWTPPCGFAAVPPLADILKQVQLTDPSNPAYQQRLTDYLKSLEGWLDKAKTALTSKAPLEPAPAYPQEIQPLTEPQQPTTLYNGMIKPLVPYAIRGAIWYQGESNHTEGMLYYEKMKALIAGWREVWNQGDFPFYYVQIAPFEYGDEIATILPIFWEAQAKALDIPHTGMAVIHDVGNLKDIHPRNKQDVGKRLALIALAKTYGQDTVVYSGPTYKSFSVEGDKLRVQFDNVGSGLVSRDGKPLTWFEIIGEETDFVPATAEIEGDSVVLSSPEVKKPVALRFAWHKLAEPNLANKDGLPAMQFRAGEVPRRDWLALKVKEAKDYKLVYDLNLAKLGNDISYDTNNAASISGEVDRIAYFLELQKTGEPTSYVYVSLPAFTQDLTKIGIPTATSGASFQQTVDDLTVISDVKGIVTGTHLEGGNIEFWPNNYSATNSQNIPNASGSVYDFGDKIETPVGGYGCMQVHNHTAKQTIFAVNHWSAGSGADIGIGNSEGQTRDWTFIANATSYETKRLRVLVHMK